MSSIFWNSSLATIITDPDYLPDNLSVSYDHDNYKSLLANISIFDKIVYEWTLNSSFPQIIESLKYPTNVMLAITHRCYKRNNIKGKKYVANQELSSDSL